MTLSATGLSFKPGACAQQVRIDGGIVTHAKDTIPIELHGSIESHLQINGGVKQLIAENE